MERREWVTGPTLEERTLTQEGQRRTLWVHVAYTRCCEGESFFSRGWTFPALLGALTAQSSPCAPNPFGPVLSRSWYQVGKPAVPRSWLPPSSPSPPQVSRPSRALRWKSWSCSVNPVGGCGGGAMDGGGPATRPSGLVIGAKRSSAWDRRRGWGTGLWKQRPPEAASAKLARCCGTDVVRAQKKLGNLW